MAMAIKVSLALAVALALLEKGSGHVCPACEHDVPVKQNVGRMALWCAREYDYSLVTFNRTLQLLEVVAAKASSIPDCSIDAGALQAAVGKAASSHAAGVVASADIQADVANFVSSDLHKTYPEFTAAFQDKLSALGRSVLESERSLGAGLGEALTGCFRETPLPLPQETLDRASVIDSAAQALVAEEASKSSSKYNNVALAWGMSIMAGLSTVFGAALVGVIKPNQHKLISFIHAFTAGVMLEGSVAGLSNEAAVLLADAEFNQTKAFWTIFIMFFLGCGVCVVLEVLIHKLAEVKATHGQRLPTFSAEAKCMLKGNSARTSDSGNESSNSEGSDTPPIPACKSQEAVVECAAIAAPTADVSRSSVIVMVAGITLHNVAEGMATFIASLANANLGIALAIGMVLHNIPEGFAISVPWFVATGSRVQGFLLAAVAGGAEVVSALAVYIFLLTVGDLQIKKTLFACLFALAGGMMTFIAIVELYPSALKKMPHSATVPSCGFFAGFAIMYLALGQLGIPR